MRTTILAHFDEELEAKWMDHKNSVSISIEQRDGAEFCFFVKKEHIKDFISKMQKAFEEIEKEQND